MKGAIPKQAAFVVTSSSSQPGSSWSCAYGADFQFLLSGTHSGRYKQTKTLSVALFSNCPLFLEAKHFCAVAAAAAAAAGSAAAWSFSSCSSLSFFPFLSLSYCAKVRMSLSHFFLWPLHLSDLKEKLRLHKVEHLNRTSYFDPSNVFEFFQDIFVVRTKMYGSDDSRVGICKWLNKHPTKGLDDCIYIGIMFYGAQFLVTVFSTFLSGSQNKDAESILSKFQVV